MEAAPTIDPAYSAPDYRSTMLRAPRRRLVPLPPELLPSAGPVFGTEDVDAEDADLTATITFGLRRRDG